MGKYGRAHHIHLRDTIGHERERVRRDMFDGSEDPTRIVLSALSGTIDEWTQEVTYHEADTFEDISGIVQTIREDDTLLGISGKIKVGHTMVLYHYDAISGVYLQHDINKVELMDPGVAGVYEVNGTVIETLAGSPMFLKVALNLIPNG